MGVAFTLHFGPEVHGLDPSALEPASSPTFPTLLGALPLVHLWKAHFSPCPQTLLNLESGGVAWCSKERGLRAPVSHGGHATPKGDKRPHVSYDDYMTCRLSLCCSPTHTAPAGGQQLSGGCFPGLLNPQPPVSCPPCPVASPGSRHPGRPQSQNTALLMGLGDTGTQPSCPSLPGPLFSSRSVSSARSPIGGFDPT